MKSSEIRCVPYVASWYEGRQMSTKKAHKSVLRALLEASASAEMQALARSGPKSTDYRSTDSIYIVGTHNIFYFGWPLCVVCGSSEILSGTLKGKG